MGCIFKLKIGNEYRIFDTEEQALAYLNDEKPEIIEWETKDKKTGEVKKSKYLVSKSRNADIRRIVLDADRTAYEETKRVLDKEEFDDFDRAKFKKESDVLSLSEVLKEFRTPAGIRLFPEYIVENYLNTICIDAILQITADTGANTSLTHTNVLNALREKLISTKERIPVVEMVRLIKESQLNDAKLCNDSELSRLDQLEQNAEELLKIDDYVYTTNLNNLKVMLRGEIAHLVLHEYINQKGGKGGTELVSGDDIKKIITKELQKGFDNNLRASFHAKYDDDATMLLKPEDISFSIDTICDQLLDKNGKMINDYINAVAQCINELEAKFSTAKEITYLSEKRITAKLSSKIEGSDKMAVRGKPDLIMIVDGVTHIVDLKCSRKSYRQWSVSKKLKTEYQLGMYQRLLNRIGIDTSGGNTYVAQIQFGTEEEDEPGRVISLKGNHIQPITVRAIPTGKNLDKFFEMVQLGATLSKDTFNEIDKVFDRTIGTVSKRGHKAASSENIKEKLKSRAHLDRKGNYVISYTMFDSDKGHDVRVTEKDIAPDALDAKLTTIAEKIVNSRMNSNHDRYKALVSDLQKWFGHNPDFGIADFALAQTAARAGESSIDIKRLDQLKATFMKFENFQNVRVIDSPELKARNLIAIETEQGIEMIACSEFGLDEAYDVLDKNATLFSNLNLEKDKYKKTHGNVAAFQAMLVANQLCKATNKQLLGITVLHLGEAEGVTMTVAAMNEIADTLPALGVQNNLSSRIADRLSVIVSMINGFTALDGPSSRGFHLTYRNIDKSKADQLSPDKIQWLKDQFGKGFAEGEITTRPSLNNREKIAMLEFIRDSFRNEYKEYFRGTQLGEINEVTQLMVEIEKAIQALRQQEVISDKDISKYGLSGAMLTSTDNIPTENAQLIRVIISDGLNYVRMKYTNELLPVQRAYIAKLNDYVGSSAIGRMTTENPVRRFDNLYERQDGVMKDLILKNPFDSNSDLGEAEKQYIKFALWVFNRHKYKWKTVKDVNAAQLQPEDYRVPLVSATGLNKLTKAGEGGIDWMAIKSMGNQMKQSYEDMKSQALSSERIFTVQEEARKKQVDDFNRVYNGLRETRENLNRREQLLAEREMNFFSTDLETILDMYFIQEESEIKFNTEVVPQIRGILYVSQWNEIMTGKSQENFMEFMTKYTKNVLFGESVMSEEVQEYMKKLAPFRSAAFTIALGWNWMNVPREVLMGFFKNISIAATGLYGEETFTIGDYMKAWGIMAADVPQFIMNVTKIEMINEFYGMGNMSISEIPEQTTSNKTGVFALFSRWMSWSLTAPDYWNRMSMFIAQMMHDGTWEAHTVEEDSDGVKRLKYDISKDRRFDIFLKYNGKIETVMKGDLDKFKKQKALYLAMVDEFNKTEDTQINWNPGDKIDLPRAYTNRERESMKSLADVSFGYYDKETKAWFFKTAVGQIFKMFLAFMSAKKCQYWQAGSDVVARGHFVELTNTKGEKVLRLQQPDGTIVNKLESELTAEEKEKAEPVMAWQGMYVEGILQSYGNLMKDVLGATGSAIKGDGTEGFKKLYKEYFKKGHIRHSNLLQLWADIFWGYLFMLIIRLLFFDDPEVTGLSYKKQLEDADVVSQNLYWIADNASRDFQIVDNFKQGFLNWDITTGSIFKRAFQSFWKSAGDDDLSIGEGVTFGAVDAIGFLRPFRPVVKDARKEAKENAS